MNARPEFLDGTGPAPLETGNAPLEALPPRRPVLGLSLFWRTFLLLAIVILGTVVAWIQMFRVLEIEPHARQTAQQIVHLVSLTQQALERADPTQHSKLTEDLRQSLNLLLERRRTGDLTQAMDRDAEHRLIATALRRELGSGTMLASSLNGIERVWVSFKAGDQAFWLGIDPDRIGLVASRSWLLWLLMGSLLSLVAAALTAQFINRPLKELSFAASRVREGDFAATHLDEHVATSEIREVNIGFNRMAQQLSKVEQDRAVMLAGISHDLRTPLARLRLETEMSVTDPVAREHMAADIEQLDAIIDKFLDYARPEPAPLKPVALREVVDACAWAVQDMEDTRVRVDVDASLTVLADEVELARVVSNLIENARRYGKTPETGIAVIDITARARDRWVMLRVRDHGMGVAPDALPNLIKPFFRGDAARTAASGAGLGLAIVDKTVQRMGGVFALANTASSGLAAHIKLQRA